MYEGPSESEPPSPSWTGGRGRGRARAGEEVRGNLRRGSGTKSYVRLLPKQRSGAAPPPPFPRPESVRFVLSPARARPRGLARLARQRGRPERVPQFHFRPRRRCCSIRFFAVRYAIVARG